MKGNTNVIFLFWNIIDFTVSINFIYLFTYLFIADDRGICIDNGKISPGKNTLSLKIPCFKFKNRGRKKRKFTFDPLCDRLANGILTITKTIGKVRIWDKEK